MVAVAGMILSHRRRQGRCTDANRFPDIGIPVSIPGKNSRCTFRCRFRTPVDIAAGAIVSAFSRVLAAGVQSVAAWAFDGMTKALLATTQVNLCGVV